ncbi:Hypothetical protein PHPALM_8694 [Phytophthora palmivora]|uniref:Uncharacterized protein n=1 Tax=Phytophthora palmivora TaxID=4796 RepID=A0A2P4Y983_9STRA|nr:Hypothetical protein PHPALM_8694 [Phytophthora palmivora]
MLAYNFADVSEALDSSRNEEEEEMTFDEVEILADTVASTEIHIDGETPCGSGEVAIDNENLEAQADEDEATPSEWPVLAQAEMMGLAKDEESLARMWKSGWQLDPNAFPPD